MRRNERIDLTVNVEGITFRNPVLPAASELVIDSESARRVAEAGVGGIVTKTFTSRPEYKVRVRPYQFPLGYFGPTFKESGSLYSLAAPHVEAMNVVMEKNVPEIAKVCEENGLPLIVSYFEAPGEIGDWQRVAKGLERAGAGMLELNFSSPTMKGDLEKSLASSFEIVESVTRSVDIPVGVKISAVMEPLVEAVKGWSQKGISFVTAHNAPSGICIDVEAEAPFGGPSIGGYAMGRSFLPISLARVIQILKAVDIPVFGVGGVFSSEDALQYLLGGCSLVEVGTAAYMEGLGVFKRIRDGIVSWMERKGYTRLSDFRGKALQKIVSSKELRAREKTPFSMPPETPYVPKINRDKCTLCCRCVRSCLYQVFGLDKRERELTIDAARCWSCGLCVGICPENAIVMTDRSTRERVIWNNRGFAAPFETE